MGSRHAATLRGFLAPEPRCTFEALNATDSSYTQAGPRPGSPVGSDTRSRLSLRMSGAQEQEVSVYATGSGNPGRDPGAHMRAAWKLDSEAATEWRGWSRPGFLHLQDTLPTWSSVLGYEQRDLVSIRSSQTAVAVWGSTSGTDEPYCCSVPPTTWTPSATSRVIDPAAAPAGDRYDDLALCVLPDERVLCMVCSDSGTLEQWRVYYTDDDGATWVLYSAQPFSAITADLGTNAVSGVTSERTRMISDSEGSVLFTRSCFTAAQRMVQYASDSLGSRFAQIGTAWTVNPPQMQCLVALKSGQIGMVYYDSVAAAIYSCVVASPWDSLESAAKTSLVGAGASSLASWVDDDGTWWVLRGLGTIGALYSSYDEGVTWTAEYLRGPDADPWYIGDANTKYLPDCAATSCGRALVLGGTVDGGGGTTYDGMLRLCHLGGWGNVEVPGWFNSALGTGLTYLPIELPSTIGAWVVGAGTGTQALVAPGCLKITTGGATTQWYQDAGLIGAVIVDFVALVDIHVISGGSSAFNRICLTLTSGDGVTRRNCQLIFSTTQYAVEDNGAGRGTVTHGVTGRLQVLIHLDATAQTCSTWYRSAHGENWTRGHTDVVIAAFASVGGSEIVWGHRSASISESDWYQCAVAWRTAPVSMEPRHELSTLVGRTLSTLPYPLPSVGTAATAARLAALSGPARVAEAWSIRPVYDYGAERMFPEVSPSPAEAWRSASDAVDQDFGWRLGNTSPLGSDTLALACFNSNVDGVYIRRWTGAAWANIAAFSPFITFDFSRTGDVITQSGALAISDYLWRGTLDGAWINLGGGKRRIIRLQEEGVLNSALTTHQARLWLDGVDGTEFAAGTAYVFPRNWVYVVHGYSASDRYQIRFQGTATPQGYHQVGTMVLGGVTYAGKQWSRGWSWERSPNAQAHQSRRGSTRVRRLGPAPRQLSVGWGDGYAHAHARGGDPDYLQATGGGQRATRDDVGWMLAAQLEEWKSGQVPVVVLTDIPEASGLIYDPTRFMLGYVASSVGLDNVEGDPADSSRREYMRSPSVTIREHI